VQAGVAVEAADRVLYLYGVIPAQQSFPTGVGVPLEAVSHEGLTAVVEAVGAREFAPAALDQKLQSLEWVALQARKHQAVLERAMSSGAVIPARLCTLFSTPEALLHSLAENQARFLRALARIEGRQEWGLKAFCDEARLQLAVAAGRPELQALDAAIAGAGPGHAFVLRKQREACTRELASVQLDALLDEVLEILEDAASEVHLLPLLPESATGRSHPMALSVATLVPVPAVSAFQATVAELSARFQGDGLFFELSGPWPTYSFCDDDDDDEEEILDPAPAAVAGGAS
jgi:hypothetical protein